MQSALTLPATNFDKHIAPNALFVCSDSIPHPWQGTGPVGVYPCHSLCTCGSCRQFSSECSFLFAAGCALHAVVVCRCTNRRVAPLQGLSPVSLKAPVAVHIYAAVSVS